MNYAKKGNSMKLRAKQKKDAPVKETGVRTINDLMVSVDEEIAQLKEGLLTEPKARVIAKNRELQLRAFELVLNAAKLEARLRPELGRRVGLQMIADTPASALPQ